MPQGCQQYVDLRCIISYHWTPSARAPARASNGSHSSSILLPPPTPAHPLVCSLHPCLRGRWCCVYADISPPLDTNAMAARRYHALQLARKYNAQHYEHSSDRCRAAAYRYIVKPRHRQDVDGGAYQSAPRRAYPKVPHLSLSLVGSSRRCRGVLAYACHGGCLPWCADVCVSC